MSPVGTHSIYVFMDVVGTHLNYVNKTFQYVHKIFRNRDPLENMYSWRNKKIINTF